MAGNQPRPGREQQPQTGGVAAYLRWVRGVVVWPESIIAGVAVWLLGFILTYLPVELLGVGGDQQLDFAILVYYESVGGVLFDGVSQVDQLGTTLGYQAALDSNAFGVGPALHALVPALVLLVGGYVLAGRHIKQGTTERPLESILAGMSLTIWFALVLFLAVAVADTDSLAVAVADTDSSPDLVVLLPVTLLYAGVFSAIGAAIRSRARLVSGWGLLGGIGAFLVGLPLFLLGSPFDGSSRASSFSSDGPPSDRSNVGNLSDVDGVRGWVDFLAEFVGEHGLEVSTVIPAWFAALVPLLFGAILAYGYRQDSPAAGLGEGARLATGYIMPVLLVVVAQVGLTAQELEDQFPDGWSSEAIDSMNYLLGASVRSILLAGIVYPALFAAIGGAVGAVAYQARQTASQPNQSPRQQEQPAGGSRRESEPGGGQSTATPQGRAGERAPENQYRQRDQSPASDGRAGDPGPDDTGRPAPGSPGSADRTEQPPASGGPVGGSGPDESGREHPESVGSEPDDTGQPPAPDEQGGDSGPDQPVGGPSAGNSDSTGPNRTGDGPADEPAGDADSEDREQLSPSDILGDEIDTDRNETDG